MGFLRLEIGNVLFWKVNAHSALCTYGTHAAAVFVSLLLLHVAALHILKEVGRASAGKPNSTKRAENNTTKILICELRKSRQIEVHFDGKN